MTLGIFNTDNKKIKNKKFMCALKIMVFFKNIWFIGAATNQLLGVVNKIWFTIKVSVFN